MTNCQQLKMISLDEKYYKTDAIDLEQLFRLIQSVLFKNVDPLKL